MLTAITGGSGISLGPARDNNVRRSVNIELDKPVTSAISLNDYNVRYLSSGPSKPGPMYFNSQISFNDFLGRVYFGEYRDFVNKETHFTTFCSSGNGQLLYGVRANDRRLITKSINGGVTWQAQTSEQVTGMGSGEFIDMIVCSDNGVYVYGITTNNRIFVSTNSGSSYILRLAFTSVSTTRRTIACSSSGVHVIATATTTNAGAVTVSSNTGTSWSTVSGLNIGSIGIIIGSAITRASSGYYLIISEGTANSGIYYATFSSIDSWTKHTGTDASMFISVGNSLGDPVLWTNWNTAPNIGIARTRLSSTEWEKLNLLPFSAKRTTNEDGSMMVSRDGYIVYENTVSPHNYWFDTDENKEVNISRNGSLIRGTTVNIHSPGLKYFSTGKFTPGTSTLSYLLDNAIEISMDPESPPGTGLSSNLTNRSAVDWLAFSALNSNNESVRVIKSGVVGTRIAVTYQANQWEHSEQLPEVQRVSWTSDGNPIENMTNNRRGLISKIDQASSMNITVPVPAGTRVTSILLTLLGNCNVTVTASVGAIANTLTLTQAVLIPNNTQYRINIFSMLENNSILTIDIQKVINTGNVVLSAITT